MKACIRCLGEYKDDDLYWSAECTGIAVCSDCASYIVTDWVNGEIESNSDLREVKERLEAELAASFEAHPPSPKIEVIRFLDSIARGDAQP